MFAAGMSFVVMLFAIEAESSKRLAGRASPP
jgi:hypothetical protein